MTNLQLLLYSKSVNVNKQIMNLIVETSFLGVADECFRVMF